MKKKNLLFLGEGQTEAKLIETFFLGRARIFNLAHNDIGKIIRTIPKPHEVHIYLMIDTDILIDSKKRECLIKNIRYLRKLKYEISILQQHGDLEDELARACSCTIPQLLSFTKSASKSELKRNFLNNVSCVTNHPKFDIKKLWKTDLIDELNEFIEYQKDAEDLPQKSKITL